MATGSVISLYVYKPESEEYVELKLQKLKWLDTVFVLNHKTWTIKLNTV